MKTQLELLNASQIGCMTDKTRVSFGMKPTGKPDISIHPFGRRNRKEKK